MLNAGPVDAAWQESEVYSADAAWTFAGSTDSYVEIDHQSSLALDSGTVSLKFITDHTSGRQTLFSKDHYGYQDGGHLTVQIVDGRVDARLQSDERSIYLRSAVGAIEAGVEHHAAVSFGDDGFRLFVDGRIADAKLDFTQGLAANDNSLVVGANTSNRDGERLNLRNPLSGEVSEFRIYSQSLDLANAAVLGGVVETPLANPTVIGGVLVGTDRGEWMVGSNVLGSYGDDWLLGSNGADRLDGGEGEDLLFGGAGDDLLVSRSDGREPALAQEYDVADDPYGELDPTSRTLYADQPLASDDVLMGGSGADRFRFEVLVNAKERILFRHVEDDGTIDWHGVTGENRLVHDHWVERLGDEVIRDFNRSEGDKIEVVGHTVDVYRVTHHDSDGDGVLDSSKMYVQSNQGGSGAHNKDQLGTIMVYGDLVLEGDYLVDSKPAYGIVETIGELAHALAPRGGSPVVSDGESRWLLPEASEGPLPEGATFAVGQSLEFDGERKEYLEVEHSEIFALDAGTVATSFVLNSTSGRQTLFSKDHYGYQQGGHLTVQVIDSRVEVRLQSDSRSVTLKSAEGAIRAGAEHHVAVSFGDDGFRLYVDGLIADAKLDFTQGLAANDNSLVIGASTTNRQEGRLNLRDHFNGVIHSLDVYAHAIGLAKAAELAGVVETPLASPTVIDGVLVGTDAGEFLTGSVVNGSYGDDELHGTAGSDRLDGGEGEDLLFGGAGDDLLVSRSDGREPALAQEYDVADDPYGELDPTSRTLYADQPLASDDVLMGGSGADRFRFEVLVNAKERILFRHVEDDGTIDWHGVTGENRLVHDHWVERLGDEVIRDFNRSEGDKIEVVGHTVDVYRVTHHDSDGDGVLDSSKMYVQSNQGGSGAHNKDQLGTIMVYGDLVLEGDYLVDSKPAYGIVETIGELAHALAPRGGSPVVSDGESRWLLPEASEGPLPEGATFAVGQSLEFDGERKEYLEVEHSEIFALDAGTVATSFVLNSTSGRQTLFSKDHYGYQQGGHLTVQVIDSRVEVRLQSDSRSVTLKSAEGAIRAGAEHHVAVSFGDDGFRLYVDGLIADAKLDFTQGLAANDNSLVIGASTTNRQEGRLNLRDHFNGVIHSLDVYAHAIGLAKAAELAGVVETPLASPTVIDGVLVGTDAGEFLTGSVVNGSYGDDELHGTAGSDRLDGGEGEDLLFGGAGDDLLVSRSDGREPALAQEYDVADDPYGELDPTSRTLYADQPLASDDVLMGGSGADRFRFEVLVNAKERILFRHVEDDGTIDWHGVTGENRLVHDHWVERLGDEVIRDFNRSEGDKIEVVGHTVDVYRVTHHDSDGDGVLDSSKMYVQSNQGGSGAHNKDQLGTIMVYGDLVLEGDYLVDSKPAYGIVETIGELAHALAPRGGSPVVSDGESRWLLPEASEGPLPEGATFAVGQSLELDGERKEYLEVEHSEIFALDAGTVATSFVLNSTSGRQTLFSKDHYGYQQGGHLTVQVIDSRVEVRLQSDSRSVTLKSAEGAIRAGAEHHVAVSFGDDGFRLYVDGLIADAKLDFTQGLAANDNSLVIGASTTNRQEGRLNLRDHFDGVIHNLVVYDGKAGSQQAATARAARLAAVDRIFADF